MRNLFKSGTSYDLIDLVVRHPGRNFYLNELAKELSRDPANITREVNKLVSEGILKVSAKQGKKYYSFNPDYESAHELRALIEKSRSSVFRERFATHWLLAEEILNTDPFFSQIWLNCFVDEFRKPGGRAYKKIVAIHKDYHMWFYYDKDDACAVGEHLVDRFVGKPSFMAEINREIVKHSDALRDFVKKLPETKLDIFSNKELWKLYKKHDDVHTAYYQWGWIPVAADMFCDNLTERGKKILKDYGISADEVDRHLATLTEPTEASLLKVEQDNLTRIAIKVQGDPAQFKLFRELFRKFKEEDVKQVGLYTHSPEYEKLFEETVKKLREKIKPEILNDLQEHYATYFYTRFLFTEEQGVYSFEHYLKELVRLVNSHDDLQKTVQEDTQRLVELHKNQEQLTKSFKLSKSHQIFFKEWARFMLTKIYRRYAQIFAVYKMVPILTEIGRRLDLSLKQVRFMTIEEIEAALLSGDIDREEIQKRVSFSVYYAEGTEHTFMIGAAAEKAVSFIQKDEAIDTDEIKGQCGARGSARGIVKIVNVVEDMPKMNKGDVLVAIATQPDLVPAMKKASAFVTDQGGVTAHAAIVAREMGTPCVIGTKIATRVLKDGDEVEVDADRGLVRIIRRA